MWLIKTVLAYISPNICSRFADMESPTTGSHRLEKRLAVVLASFAGDPRGLVRSRRNSRLPRSYNVAAQQALVEERGRAFFISNSIKVGLWLGNLAFMCRVRFTI
jgi:hypothetical protein